MKIISIFSLVLGLIAVCCGASAAVSSQGNVLVLVDGGKPVCELVVIGDKNSDFLLNRSADLIGQTVAEWSGAKLSRAALSESNHELPTGQAVVLATLDTLKRLSPDLSDNKEFAKAAEIDPQGFVCVPRANGNIQQLFIVSQTPRGVYNGAVYLRDFCIDGTKQNLTLDFHPIVRSPKMGGRTGYTLTIWGQEAKYTAADWQTIFDRFARDGMDRIYFWASGHFPSEKFPQTYRCQTVVGGKTFDTTVDSKIGTVADLRQIVQSAHQLGMKIYLGGGLGCWCGTIHLTNDAPETMKQGPTEPSLCPSNPRCREALVAYYQELFAAVPEADGLFIESADEAGGCNCPVCGKSIDALGSKQFGQSQLTLCQEIMNSVWRDHPHARLAYTIGYQEHVKDPAYYDLVKRLSTDSRFEWMEPRNSWTFPGPNGEPRPAPYFSPQVMRWKQYYNRPLEEIVTEANRADKEGLYGLIMSFEPGYATGSFYKEIPFPTDILPYALTGFIYHEATWDPALTVEEMRDRTQKRFFGKDAPEQLSDDLWSLREIIRTKKGVEKIGAIETHIKQAQSNAGPKTNEGLAIMTRAVNDIRKYLTK